MPAVAVQPVTGVVPPQEERRIRLAWPSVQRFAAVATLGHRLTRTIFLAPLAWLLMAPFYFAKVLPLVGRRYLLTNQRVAILGGWSAKTVAEAKLADIHDVKIESDANSTFFRAATIQLLDANGRVLLALPGTPDPESFRVSVINACNAWAGKKIGMHFIPASTK